MKTAGYISVFGGFLFAALSAGSTHHSLNDFTAAAGLHQGTNVSWKEIVSLILMLAGGILLLISREREKEKGSSLQKS
jgi:hypothetical protein